MMRALGYLFAIVAAAVAGAGARAADATRFWDLKPEHLRVLVASPQVMVSRTPAGFDAYCRCPVILKPDEIPTVMKEAIVAVEDKRYFDHGGVDLVALVAALKGGLNRGASTIPMQLLKNLVFHDLQQRNALSRLERKGAELWHAGTFTGAVGKDELLAAYLNQIEFGGREIVGLYRASRHYFRKEPKDLTLYEAAMLAGMVQAPARFNPLKETTRQRAHERAKLVLRLMAEQGRITEAQRRHAEQMGIRPGMLPEFKIQTQAFTEWVAQTWGPRFVKEGETIRFFVTIDPRIQDLAENELHNLVSEGAVPPEYEAAAVMMTGRGEVQAMIGAIDWSQRQFNSAVKAEVQPGSTAKLPLLITACEKGRAPDSRVLDRPITGEWPSNGSLGYRGETTLKEAFASSRNAAAVRLTRELGVDRVAETSRRLGIDPGAKPDLDFVLGTFSTNVLAMTAAYATVANGGYRVEPTGVLAVVDGRGEVRANLIDAARSRVVLQRCIGPTRTVLRDVVQSGTGRGARLLRWEAFGKTGTTTGNADAWFIGWSEGRVLGVWMGKPRGTEGGTLAGMGAPAAFFRRVSNRVNEAMEQRLRQEKRAKEPPPAVASRPTLKETAGSIRQPEYTSGQGRRSTPSARAGKSRPTVAPLPPRRPSSGSPLRLAPSEPGGAS